MKNSKIIPAIFLFLLIATFSFSAIAQNDGVEKLHQLYTSTINTATLDNLDALYTQDASVRNSDGSMVSGLDNIKAQYKATFSSGKYNIDIKTIEETPLDKDYMFVSGSFVFTKLDDPRSEIKGEYVNTLKRVNGDWKIYKSYRYPETTHNIVAIDKLYKAFSAGDIPTVLAGMDPKVVWNEAEGNSYADGNPYIGPDAVLNGVFARVGADFEYFNLTDVQLHEMSNNQVLATLRYQGKYKKNGATIDAQVAHLWTLKNGKVTAFQQYVDTKQLAEAENKEKI